jgi:hypothetical protein
MEPGERCETETPCEALTDRGAGDVDGLTGLKQVHLEL